VLLCILFSDDDDKKMTKELLLYLEQKNLYDKNKKYFFICAKTHKKMANNKY
jgi:hypothetical protein